MTNPSNTIQGETEKKVTEILFFGWDKRDDTNKEVVHKIVDLITQAEARGKTELFYKILEEYQPFDEKERQLFRLYMATLKKQLTEKENNEN